METPGTRRRADLSTGPVHYREAGPSDGPPVVFVHGFLVDDTLWADVPERLAAQGFHTYAPTWPLGSHREAMRAGADLSPRGVARLVLEFVEAMGLDDVVLVGNDTGGAVCQLALAEDAGRIGRLVLTDCDAFETFPPTMFVPLFWAARHPALLRAALSATRSARLRNGPLGFGPLVRRPLAPEETLRWVAPYLEDPAVRRDVATFARAWRRDGLTGVVPALAAYDRPVLLCWSPEDTMFRISLAHRLLETFPDARLVEMPDASTFVALDQPARLAEEIAAFARDRSPR